jgi:hypothetical protein
MYINLLLSNYSRGTIPDTAPAPTKVGWCAEELSARKLL